jgi:hypothetical protein
MQVVPESTFRSWLAEAGIRPHSRLGSSDVLAFQQAEDLSRFWFPSFVPSDLPGFVLTALEAASPQGPHYLMRRSGIDWYESEPETAPGSNLIIDDLLRAAGVPAGAAGALRFEKTDWKALQIVVLAHYVHGWSVGEDLHMFGEERDCAMMTSHHGKLRVAFPSDARLERFREHMLLAGYDLPAQLPNDTFKCPAWLTGPVRHGPA